ncbi:MAG TPA: phosphatase PAP2 family protein [Mycobacteriales bacterium]|nr:phosphatase PAP2 family protein [Mycobacteriales bacterium]
MLETLKHLALDDRTALPLAAGTGIAGLLLLRATGRRAALAGAMLREATLVLLLFALWLFLGARSVGALSAADGRGRAVLRAERWLHLEIEPWLQHTVLGHPLLVQGANYLYACVHFPAMIAFLVWAFVRHRPQYAGVRLRLVLVTLICMLVQFVPVAPPRLVPSAHLVDTAARYHQSVYAGAEGVAQLSAMPSVHVAWAVLIAWEVLRLTGPRGRWLILHPLLTLYVVCATGNHWFLDGVAGALVVAAVELAVGRARRLPPVAGDPCVLVIADSLAWHGPERAELLTEPRLWPNLAATELGLAVEVVGRQGWTARDAWGALTKDPRTYSLLLPRARAVVLAVGNMDQLPVAVPTYLREGLGHLPTPRLRELARRAYLAGHPPLVRALRGPLRVLPQRETDAYLSRCVRALRALRPDLPVLGVVPPPWRSKYYPSRRTHPAAVVAAREWGRRERVPLVDWDAAVAGYVPAGLNPDGLHWGWAAHRQVATVTGAALGSLLKAPAG